MCAGIKQAERNRDTHQCTQESIFYRDSNCNGILKESLTGKIMTIMQGIDYMILGLIFTRCQFSGGIVKDSKMQSERSADAEFRRLLYKIVR